MMKYCLRYGLYGCCVWLFACSAAWQTYSLDEDQMTGLHVKGHTKDASREEEELKKGVPAKGYYNGDLLGGAIWWARKGITIDKEEDFTVIAEAIGPESTPFGATFPPLDFTIDHVMIKVVARAEGAHGMEPELVLQLHDGNGYVTNKQRPTITIKSSEDAALYYFELKDVFMQADPEPHSVNGGFINSLQLYINPGGEPFTGKLIIDELRVVSGAKME